MTRNSKTSLIDSLIELASLLPWRAGVAIAVAAYLGLHYIATMTVVAPTALNGMGVYVSRQIYVAFANFMQYIVPIAFLIGAGMSAYKGRYRARLLDKQSGIESIRAMSWRDFEMLVGETFRRQGYMVEERGGGAPDGGIDLALYKGGKKTVVQCKRWKSYSINVSLVRELYGVMVAEDADECVFVSSGSYTPDAMDFAKGKPIRLIDGGELAALIRQVQQAPRDNSTSPEPAERKPYNSPPPACPRCGSPMVERTAKMGANAGKRFWGCPSFPACRGVRWQQ